jgi:protein TonB
MDTRFNLRARNQARGAVRPVTIAIVAVFSLLAVAAWFLIIQPHQELVMDDAGGHPSTPVATGQTVAPPPVNVGAMNLNELLAEARKAMNEHRLLAPAGNNAFEFYLKALEKQPGNPVASDALRETFPFAANSAEQAINGRDFNEAQRQIDLLAKADPANYTLTILRSKLDAQRKLLDREQQQVVDQQKQQLAATKAAAEKAAADKAAASEQQKAEVAAAKAPTHAAPSHAPAAAAQGGADTASTTPEASAQTSAAVLLKAVSPRYPIQAKRSNQEGVVVVGYTVGVDGSVSNVKVVSSQPRHIFDRDAMDAVQRWKFQPAMRGGVAVESTGERRIEFKLGQ